MNADLFNHAVSDMFNDAVSKAADYEGRISDPAIPTQEDVECIAIATYYRGVAAGLQELRFRLSMIDPEIDGGI